MVPPGLQIGLTFDDVVSLLRDVFQDSIHLDSIVDALDEAQVDGRSRRGGNDIPSCCPDRGALEPPNIELNVCGLDWRILEDVFGYDFGT